MLTLVARPKNKVPVRVNTSLWPFFLYLPWQAVHEPHEAPDGWTGDPRYSDDENQYRGMLWSVDQYMGQLVNLLKSKKMWDNTLLVYSAGVASRAWACFVLDLSFYGCRQRRDPGWEQLSTPWLQENKLGRGDACHGVCVRRPGASSTAGLREQHPLPHCGLVPNVLRIGWRGSQ